MAWLFFVIVIAVLGAMAYVLRARHADQREAERAREEAFLLEMNVASRASPAATAAPTAPPDGSDRIHVQPASSPAAAAAPVPGSGRGYLDHAHHAVYRWLRTGLPRYEVFPRASLRRVVGRERVAKDAMLDFVICNASLEVVAAVDLARGEADAVAAFKRETLGEVGVKYACWQADRLPEQLFLEQWIETR